MACFVVPAAQAVVTTVLSKVMKSKEKEKEKENHGDHALSEEKIPFSRKLKWLNNLLWGGSALLAFEHLWHGEITLTAPFLTGVENPVEMLTEMATAGTGMAALVTAVWLAMVAVSSAMEKKLAKSQPAED